MRVQVTPKTRTNIACYYTLNSLTLFWLAESVQWIFQIIAYDVITADYTIIMSRTPKVTGNHVMYDRSAWFLRVIMSSSLALWCLPSVIILDITKIWSNKCLIFVLQRTGKTGFLVTRKRRIGLKLRKKNGVLDNKSLQDVLLCSIVTRFFVFWLSPTGSSKCGE